MSERSTRGAELRLFVLVAVGWLVPFGLFTLFVATAELPPPLHRVAPFEPLVTAYVLAWALGVAAWLVHRRRRLIALRDDRARRGEMLRRLRRTLVALPVLLLVYELVGGILALAVAGQRFGLVPDNWTGVPLWAAVGVLALSYAMILLPVGIVVLDEFGRDFGEALDGEVLVPLWLRSVPGPGNAVVIVIAFLLSEFALTGSVATSSIVLGVTLVPFALFVMLLNVRYSGNALVVMNRAFAADERGERIEPDDIRSEALDEIGTLYADLRRLLGRLRASESRVSDFLDAASDLFFETDVDLRIRWVSPTTPSAARASEEWFHGRSLFEILEEFPVQRPDELRAALDRREPLRDVLVPIDDEHGLRQFRVSLVPWRDEAGAFAGYRCAGKDVSDLLSVERELRERETQLAQAQKMDAVGQLTGGVAHDFNNLLQVIGGNIELLRDEPEGPDREELLDQAASATQRGAAMIQQLLSFARRQMLRPEALDVVRCLTAMQPLLRTTVGERIALVLDLPPHLARPVVDAAQFESALLNLVLNARDAMPAGGTLRIVCRDEIDDEGARRVCVLVEDSGEGMSEAVRQRVFEPFFSTKPIGRGTGLGLSMVFGFVMQSEGTVEIESAPGEGTRLRMCFPVDGVAAPVPTVPKPALRRVSRRVRILLVEDDPAVRATLAAGLRARGHVVETAGDAAEGRARLEASDPEVLLSDVVLPGSETGADLVSAARVLRPELHCLLMSGFTDLREAGVTAGLDDVRLIHKPFTIEGLVREIDDLFEAAAPA